MASNYNYCFKLDNVRNENISIDMKKHSLLFDKDVVIECYELLGG